MQWRIDMHCPYNHCNSADILQLFATEGARPLSNSYGTVQTTYYRCLACGHYFKHVSFSAPLSSTEKREAMTAELKAMSELRGNGIAFSRAI
jgi:hypothetical protein